MNSYASKLYTDLMTLCETSEKKAFFFCDQELEGVTYRIFNYRLASYTDFLAPSALECRGITFSIKNGEINLVSHPMSKFFNIDENPFTMNLDFSKPRQIMIKMDGSLISTFNHNNTVRLKSKGSIQSTQVIESTQLLHSKPDLHELLTYLTVIKDYTVNMEYCSPTNRIVVGYMEPTLTILNVRNNKNGEYVHWNTLFDDLTSQNKKHLIYPLSLNWVEVLIPPRTNHEYIYDKYVITEDEGFEGYVIQLNNGQFCKRKMQWYLHLHKNKDSITNPRRLFEAVLDEVTDDLRTLFHDDPLSLKIITEMEELVESIYNPLVDRLEKFYHTNKHLERKEYAILGQQTFINGEFGLAMNMYLNKDVRIKDFLKKNFKNYGVKEVETLEE